jgi:hypothetical protein
MVWPSYVVDDDVDGARQVRAQGPLAARAEFDFWSSAKSRWASSDVPTIKTVL